MKPYNILNLSEFAEKDWNWLSHRFPEHRWTHVSMIPPGGQNPVLSRLNGLRVTWQAIGGLNRPESPIIVAHGPRPAWSVGEVSRLKRVTAPVLAYAFNFTTLPQGFRRRMMAQAFKRVDRFVVPSTHERGLYSDWFGIDPAKIDVLLWPINPPDFDPAQPALEPPGYICAVGGNARDYGTAIEAMRMLPDKRLVIVCRPENLAGIGVPANVKVYTNIPISAVWNIVHHSDFMVLPLTTATVPCGHVTLVIAMYLGKAIVVTDSAGVHDYVRQGDNAILVPDKDSTSLAEAIEQLSHSTGERDRMGQAGLRFVTENCSEDAAVAYFQRYLASL